MDYISTSAISLCLRLLLSRLSPDSPRTSLIQTGITGLWEGLVLHRLSNDSPQSFFPHLKFITTLWLGHVVGEDTKFELLITSIWSVVGAMLAEAIGEIYAYDSSRRERRRSSSSHHHVDDEWLNRERTISNSSESQSTGTRRVAFSPIITTVEPPGINIGLSSSSGPQATSSPRMAAGQMERTESLDSAVMRLISPPLVPGTVPLAITLGTDATPSPTSPGSPKSPDLMSPTGPPLFVRMAPSKPVSILRTTPRTTPRPTFAEPMVQQLGPGTMPMPVPAPAPAQPVIAMPVPVPPPTRPFLLPEEPRPELKKDKDKARQPIPPPDELQNPLNDPLPSSVTPTPRKRKTSLRQTLARETPVPIPVPPPPVVSQTIPRRPISSSSLLLIDDAPPPIEPLSSRPASGAPPPAYKAAERASIISNISLDSVGNISTISAVGKEALLKRAQLYRDQARDQESERDQALRRQREARRKRRLGEAFLEAMAAKKAGKSASGLHGKAERRYYLAHNDTSAPNASQLPTVDVHGLLKTEAIRKTEDALCDAILASHRQLRVIVGKGNHSKDGVPVLKPAIKTAMESQGLTVSVDPKNEGVLILTCPTL